MESRQCANEAEAARSDRWEVAKSCGNGSSDQQGDANPLSKSQDWKLKEVEGDVPTEDGINDRRAARVKGDGVLPEADRLPVCGNLHANEERDNECADTQDATPHRSCRATAASACTEEIA